MQDFNTCMKSLLQYFPYFFCTSIGILSNIGVVWFSDYFKNNIDTKQLLYIKDQLLNMKFICSIFKQNDINNGKLSEYLILTVESVPPSHVVQPLVISNSI